MRSRYYPAVTTVFLAVATLLPGQTAAPTPAAPRVGKGMPPRAGTTEYLSRAQVGGVGIGAEFDRHSVPTADSLLSTEDYIVVEVGLFGAPGAHLTIADGDFSLRINGKKAALPVEQFAAVFKNLRDPNWIAPEVEAAKKAPSGNGINAGGGAEKSDLGATPPPVHIPPAMERAMSESVRNAALPEGDRALPVAGLLFFRYGGSEKGIKSVELLYAGPAGKTTVTLQP